MFERSVSSPEVIAASLEKISSESHFMEVQRREAQKEYPLWPVASAGTFVGFFESPGYDRVTRSSQEFVVNRKLIGEARSLRYRTLVEVQALELPADMSEQGIERYLYARSTDEEAVRRIGFVALNEPGLTYMIPVKTNVSSYFDSENQGVELATEAIDRYLNTDTDFHSEDDERQAIHQDAAIAREAYQESTRRAFDSLFRSNKNTEE